MSQGFLWWSSVRLRAPNIGNVDSMPGWGSKIPHATQQREGEKERSVPPPSSSKSRVCVSVCVCVCVCECVCPGDGNGNPLQYSCLENPVDRGAWWAVVYGVAESQTQLTN